MTRIDYRDYHTSDDAVGAYHNVYASGYYAAQWRQLEQPLLEKLFTELHSHGATRLLDIACGQGRITLVAAKHFEEVKGIDFSPAMLERAQRAQAEDPSLAAANLQFDEGDVRTFTADNPFDVITAFRFFLNAEDDLRVEGLRCVRRNLKPGGTFITNVHVASSSPLAGFYGVANTLHRLRGKTVSRVRNSMSLAALRELMAAEGFRIERVYRYSFLPRIGSKTDSLAEKHIAKVDRMAGVIPGLKLLSQAFLVTARPV